MRIRFLFFIALSTGCTSHPEKPPAPPPVVVIPAAPPAVIYYRPAETWLSGKLGGAAWQDSGYAHVLWREEPLPLKTSGKEPAALAANPSTPLAKPAVELPAVELIATQPRSCPQ